MLPQLSVLCKCRNVGMYLNRVHISLLSILLFAQSQSPSILWSMLKLKSLTFQYIIFILIFFEVFPKTKKKKKMWLVLKCFALANSENSISALVTDPPKHLPLKFCYSSTPDIFFPEEIRHNQSWWPEGVSNEKSYLNISLFRLHLLIYYEYVCPFLSSKMSI